MVTTTVKLDESDKRNLEKLQALITLKSGGKKLTQQELLSTLIVQALQMGDEFIEQVIKDTVPMSDREFDKVLSLEQDWGITTRWQEIDQAAYGIQKKRK